MGKMIIVTPDNEVRMEEYTDWENLKKNIDCDIAEHIRPVNLYKELRWSTKLEEPEDFIPCMMVDEEYLFKHHLFPNHIASYLYGTGNHGHPIYGTVVFIAEGWNGCEFDLVGLPDEAADQLKEQLDEFAKIIRVQEILKNFKRR